jgi:acetoin:2,6-dichlorophenolindophenol oxidoreductase subunit beta
MPEKYLIKAMHDALRAAMREDDRVVLIGEDVSRGVTGATKGLIDEFGPTRVRDTPISEQAFAGACVGAAAAGLRPVADLMFSSFFYVAMDAVANQAAKLRYMSGGQVELPIVYIATSGPSGSAAAQHSESPHPMLMNVAGLKIVMPSTPYDAKGLLMAAIRDPNPVIYLQDAEIGGLKGPVPDEPYEVELGVADIKREGTDVTLVALGATVRRALAVAETLAVERGLSIEVIDPRSLAPLDERTIVASVHKTGRLVVVDNARQRCSAASEIAALVAEQAWDALVAAPRRVAQANVPMPYAPNLELEVTVREENIRAAVLDVVNDAEAMVTQ